MSPQSDDRDLVARALSGEASALETLVRGCQDRVYNLALRFLWHPEDAEDAAQEILTRVITHLGTFRGASSFATWVHSIAVHHLLNVRKGRMERREISFESVGEELRGVPADFVEDVQDRELAYQVKIACTHAMLLCLSRENRIAFILGVVFDVSSEEGAAIMGLSREAYRQRLSRARSAMESFLGNHCGLVNAAAPCRCEKRVRPCAANGSIQPYLNLAESILKSGEFRNLERDYAGALGEATRLAEIYRTNPEYRAPAALLRRIQSLVQAGRIFEN